MRAIIPLASSASSRTGKTTSPGKVEELEGEKEQEEEEGKATEEEENVWELLITGKGQKERIAYCKYGKMLGIDLKPHDFRHNLATTLLNAGAQLSEVQDILGHANLATTKMIYARYDKGHLREAFTRYKTSPDNL